MAPCARKAGSRRRGSAWRTPAADLPSLFPSAWMALSRESASSMKTTTFPIFPGESRDLRLIFRLLRGTGAARRLTARVRGWNVAEAGLDGSVEVLGG